jgi:chromate reductase
VTWSTTADPGVSERDRLARDAARRAALWGKTADGCATTGQYGAIWAQQDLRRVLGIAGARVVEGELPVARAQDVFDDSGDLLDEHVAERLRRHLTALVAEASPVAVAA